MNELASNTSDRCAELDSVIRENPTRALLFVIGAGVGIALIIRALQPRPAENRAARLLEDLRDRLSDLGDPAYRHASGLASNGSRLVHDGVDQLANLHLDRSLNRVTGKLRKFFR